MQWACVWYQTIKTLDTLPDFIINKYKADNNSLSQMLHHQNSPKIYFYCTIRQLLQRLDV